MPCRVGHHFCRGGEELGVRKHLLAGALLKTRVDVETHSFESGHRMPPAKAPKPPDAGGARTNGFSASSAAAPCWCCSDALERHPRD